MLALVTVKDGEQTFRTVFDFFVPMPKQLAERFSSGFTKDASTAQEVAACFKKKFEQEVAPFRTVFQPKGLEALLLMRKPWKCAFAARTERSLSLA
jgi:hypothetical protein